MPKTPDPLVALQESLTDAETAQFLAESARRWPRLDGAHVADVLEMTTDYDLFLDKTEPFFEYYGEALPAAAPNTAVLHLLIIMGRELTTENLVMVLEKAGLLPAGPRAPAMLTWRRLAPDGGAWVTQGPDGTSYLVTTGPDGQTWLTRWPGGGLTHLLDTREAVHSAIVVNDARQGRRLAEKYAGGNDLEGLPGWTRGHQTGQERVLHPGDPEHDRLGRVIAQVRTRPGQLDLEAVLRDATPGQVQLAVDTVWDPGRREKLRRALGSGPGPVTS